MIKVVNELNGTKLDYDGSFFNSSKRNIQAYLEDGLPDGTWFLVCEGYTRKWYIDTKPDILIAIDESNLEYIEKEFDSGLEVYTQHDGGYYFALVHVKDENGDETENYDKAIDIVEQMNNSDYLDEDRMSEIEGELQDWNFNENTKHDLLANSDDEEAVGALYDLISGSNSPSEYFESISMIEELLSNSSDWQEDEETGKWLYIGE